VTIFGDTAATIINSVRLFNTALIDGASGISNEFYPIPIKLARGTAITSAAGGTINTANQTIDPHNGGLFN